MNQAVKDPEIFDAVYRRGENDVWQIADQLAFSKSVRQRVGDLA